MKKQLILLSILGLILQPLKALAEPQLFWEDLPETNSIKAVVTGLNPGETYQVFSPLALNNTVAKHCGYYRISLADAGLPAYPNTFYPQGFDAANTQEIPTLDLKCTSGILKDSAGQTPATVPDAFQTSSYIFFKVNGGTLSSEAQLNKFRTVTANQCGMISAKQQRAGRPLNNNIFIIVKQNGTQVVQNGISGNEGTGTVTPKSEIPFCKKIGNSSVMYVPKI